ncbi:ABC transporter permease [Bacillus sp. M6-12]|uniref:ABC transporter permease n=1 Tax=Bacillus sp. M6-12 TaxID=2054166 RepID=UPI000C76750A|nr:ABC transporter permease [Bacillus sp. M6-12]PLS14790.1 ABC transporter permease [Bacillus sp. M6-12]
MGYLISNFDRVIELFLEHLYLVSISLFVSLIISTILGITISRYKILYTPVIGSLGIIYTIPSIALFALMIPFLGLGFTSAFIALVAYSLMILVRNIVAAIRGIDSSIIEAARGMGMGKWRILVKVELPLALPVVVAGVRIATVSIIGIAAIAAYINAGGLGELIFEGIYQDHSQKIIAGTIAVAVLAIAADLGFRVLEKKLSTEG